MRRVELDAQPPFAKREVYREEVAKAPISQQKEDKARDVRSRISIGRQPANWLPFSFCVLFVCPAQRGEDDPGKQTIAIRGRLFALFSSFSWLFYYDR